MANQWLRLWHDMPNDPKWRNISKCSKQPISLVMSTYIHLLVMASVSEERGTFQLQAEDLANALDAQASDIDSIIEAMQGRVIKGNNLMGMIGFSFSQSTSVNSAFSIKWWVVSVLFGDNILLFSIFLFQMFNEH